MTFVENFVVRLCIFSSLFSAALAAPTGADLVKRAGDNPTDPIEANFDITGWEDLAEEDCYAMLYLLGGKKV